MLLDYKSLLASRTFWGAALAMAATGLKLAGYELGVEDQAALTNVGLNVVALAGSLLAIYGRVKATKKIG